MNKLIFILAFILVFFGCQVKTSNHMVKFSSDECLRERMSTVKIFTPTSLGSGIFLNSEYILTDYHVVHDSDVILVKFPTFKDDIYDDGLIRDGKVVSEDKDLDLALIKLTKPIPMNLTNKVQINNLPAVDEIIHTVGYPKGMPIMYSTGRVSNYFKAPDYLKMILNVECDEGSSGGPVFNSDGAVVGLVRQVFTDNFSIVIAISGRDAGNWLVKIGHKEFTK